MCTMSYMAVEGYRSCASLLALILAISIAVITITNRPLLDPSDITSHNEVELQAMGIVAQQPYPAVVSNL
jgi:hypothetical protein